MVLRQLQGNHKGLLLSLTAFTSHGVSVNHNLQIVTMNAVQRIAHSTILEAVALDDLQQRPPLTM